MKSNLFLQFLLCGLIAILSSYSLSAQSKLDISGTVTDVKGSPLVGVTVVEKGSTNGVITNENGVYNIVADESSTLLFTFIGMTPEEVNVNNSTEINITLEQDMVGLDEIVVVGYGTQKKINLTGSVSSVSTDDLATRPVTNMSTGLSGMAAGVHVVQNSGGTAGGDGASIRIRGIGTFSNNSTSNNPLIVVDGVPSEGTGIMNDIDPNDIENISVLKDAASASIYGSRGANGVILITTKRGKSGMPRLTYNAYYGQQSITRGPEYISDFALYMETANRIWGNKTFSDEEIQTWRDNPNDPLHYPNVNWFEEIYGGSSPIMSHNIGYSGGNDITQYRFSLNYLDQEGITSGNNFKRYGFRTNLTSEVAKGVQLGGNVFFRWSDLTPNPGGSVDIGWSPSIPNIKHPDGRWGGAQSAAVGTVTNAYANIENNVINDNDRRLLGDIFANWEIVPGLKAMGKIALNYNQGVRNTFNKRYDIWDFNRNVVSREFQLAQGRQARVNQDQNYQLNTNLLLEYSKNIAGHNVKVLGGYETLQYRSDRLSVVKQNFPNNEVQGLNAGLELVDGTGSIAEWSMISYFGRVNYDFNNKYLLEANFRADGSSRFKKNSRWGYFPSFSAGWNISEESFMSDLKLVNLLKLRASWGQLGNNRIGNYAYHPTYALNQNYSFNGTVHGGIAQTALTDESIKWEETTTTDIGIDAGFLENKITFTADYFVRTTDGILVGLPVPQFIGAKSNPIVNLASMENKGVETVLGYRGSVGQVRFNVSANLTILNNKVTEYRNDIVTGGTQVGHPYNSFYGYEVVGIFTSQEQLDNAAEHRNNTGLGDLEIKDQITEDTDGDGIPDAANGTIGIEDRKIIGNRIPKYTYGGNIGLTYRGFDFNVLLQGIAKRDRNTYGPGITPMNWVDRGVIHQKWLDEEWSEENTGGTLPRMNQKTRELNATTSTFWVKNVSYLRVKNIQLGYDFTKSLLVNKGFSKLRLYVSADNIFTFTNEEWGFDPESDNLRAIPNVKTLILGVNVGF